MPALILLWIVATSQNDQVNKKFCYFSDFCWKSNKHQNVKKTSVNSNLTDDMSVNWAAQLLEISKAVKMSYLIKITLINDFYALETYFGIHQPFHSC